MLCALLFLSASFSVGCDGGADPGPANDAPRIVRISSEVISVSPVTFDLNAEATDAEGDELTYTWDLGDGSELVTGESITHSYSSEGRFTVKLTVEDGNNAPVSDVVFLSTELTAVSIDLSAEVQTIEGFGGFGTEDVWWSSQPFRSPSHATFLIEDMGVTILRDNIPENFEISNDNDDPNNIALSKFNISEDTPGADAHMGQHLPWIKAMGDAGLDKLIASVWSPPLFMKHINHRGNGINDANHPDAYSAPPYTYDPDETTNQLRRDMFEEFAEYLVAYVKIVKIETGVDVYAISIQNEPYFSQFYSSCVYDVPTYLEVLKIVGDRFDQEGLDVKLFGNEDVRIMSRINTFLDGMIADQEAADHLDIVAIHNYQTDGIQPGDLGPTNWATTRQKANINNQQVWMTETSGFETTWDGAMSLAQSMYNALKFGEANAWVYWQISNGGDNALMTNGEYTPLGHVSKHFYRWIRPGAVYVESTTEDSNLLSLSFKHPTENTETTILINLDTESHLAQVPTQEYQVFTSTNADRLVETSSSAGVVTVPPESIVTLYASNN